MKGKLVVGILVLAVLGGLTYAYTRTPRNDGIWSPGQEFLATTTTNADGTITISHVRDWTYNGTQVASTTWETITVDPSKIARVWFITEPFTANPLVGHTYLTFEFSNSPPLSFSIESRNKLGEKYSATLGVFPHYELIYMWGTERDYLSRRLEYLNHTVRMYPLVIPNETSRLLLTKFATDTNALAAHPRFYNTLTANCTNELARIANTVAPDALPYDISWNLTGIADLYLMDKGFISEIHNSKAETRDQQDLAPFRSEIAALATSSPEEFSSAIRKFLNN
jgi:hypothetical protein